MRAQWSIVAITILLAGCAGGGGESQVPIPAAPAQSNLNPATTIATLPHFAVVDLGAHVQPQHINDAGAVLGAISDTAFVLKGGLQPDKAFVWSGGSLQQLPPLGGYATATAYWINNSGEIVGTSYGDASNNYAFHATRWGSGHPTDLGTPPEDILSSAYSVNNNGTIVGSGAQNFGLPDAPSEEVAVFDGNGTASGYISNGVSYGGEAYAVNDGGEIVGALCCPYSAPDLGTEAFVAPPFTILTMPANSGDGAAAVDVNSHGDVVGWYKAGPFNRHNATCCGFLSRNGTITEIDDPSGGNYLVPHAINDSDWIVGTYGSFTLSKARAFVYDGKVVDLNTLIPANCNWVLNEATSVNLSGQIVGIGLFNGTPHGFLLNPVH